MLCMQVDAHISAKRGSRAARFTRIARLERAAAGEVSGLDAWCDGDGEFLTGSGFARIACEFCEGDAVRRSAGRHRCMDHLESGDAVPLWLRVLMG